MGLWPRLEDWVENYEWATRVDFEGTRDNSKGGSRHGAPSTIATASDTLTVTHSYVKLGTSVKAIGGFSRGFEALFQGFSSRSKKQIPFGNDKQRE
jgi:hypothetical protein